MDHSLDLLLLENGENLECESGADIALESYKFRWVNLPGMVYSATDETTIFAEQLNDILDRLDAGGL